MVMDREDRFRSGIKSQRGMKVGNASLQAIASPWELLHVEYQ